MFLLYTEFNHLIILLGYVRGMKFTGFIISHHEIIISLLLTFSTLIILYIGLIRKTRFLRIYSMILLAGILAKIMIIDLPTMGPITKTVLFLILGAMLLMISFFYTRVQIGR